MNNKIKNLLIKASTYLWGLFLYWSLLKPKSNRNIVIPQWIADIQPDKWVHAILWFVWILSYEWSSEYIEPLLKRRFFYFLVILSIPITEFLQYTMNLGRTADIWDALADLIGFLLGILLFRNKKSGR